MVRTPEKRQLFHIYMYEYLNIEEKKACETAHKTGKTALRFYLNGAVLGSRFKVKGLQPIDTTNNINQNIEYPSYPIG